MAAVFLRWNIVFIYYKYKLFLQFELMHNNGITYTCQFWYESQDPG